MFLYCEIINQKRNTEEQISLQVFMFLSIKHPLNTSSVKSICLYLTVFKQNVQCNFKTLYIYIFKSTNEKQRFTGHINQEV